MYIALGRKYIDLVLMFLHLAAFLALMVMMLTVVANIVGRIFFRSPIMGTLEVAGFCGVIFVSAAIGLAQKERRNIYVDILVQRFTKPLRRITDSFTYLLSLVAIGFLCWAVADSTIDAFIDNDVTLTLDIQTYPFRFIWTIGLIILIIFLIRHLYEFIKGGDKK